MHPFGRLLLACLLALPPSTATAIAMSPEDIARIRDLGNRDLQGALRNVEERLAGVDAKDCSRGTLELLLLAGDLYLAGSLDGQLERNLLPRVRACETDLQAADLRSRLHKLEAYATQDVEAGIELAKDAEREARESGSYSILAEALQVKSYLLANLGLVEQSGEALREAITLAQSGNDSLLLARMYSDFAYRKARAGDPEGGLQYVNDAIGLAQAVGASRVLMSMRLHRAIVNTFLDDHATAEAEVLELLEEARAAGNANFEAVLLNNYASSLNRHGKHLEAERRAAQALRIARAIPSRRLEMNSLANLASAQRASGDVAAAAVNFEAALQLARDAASYVEAQILKELSAVYYQQQDFRRAYEYSALGAQMHDENMRRNTRLALSEVQARFDVVNARNARDRLQQELNWQGERLRQQRYILVLGGIVAMLSVVLIALLARKYRRVRKLNRRLETRAHALEVSSNNDPLTGAFNRRYLNARLHDWCMETVAANASGLAAFLILDLDHFKQLNDSEGHAAGDAALIEFAKRMKAILRNGDVFVRWGGDEFCVLARVASREEAQRMAERIVRDVHSRPFVLNGDERKMTSSVGTVTLPARGLTEGNWPHVMESADIALYIAKRMGRNRSICLEFSVAPDAVAIEAMRKDPFMASIRGFMQIHDCLSRTVSPVSAGESNSLSAA